MELHISTQLQLSRSALSHVPLSPRYAPKAEKAREVVKNALYVGLKMGRSCETNLVNVVIFCRVKRSL